MIFLLGVPCVSRHVSGARANPLAPLPKSVPRPLTVLLVKLEHGEADPDTAGLDLPFRADAGKFHQNTTLFRGSFSKGSPKMLGFLLACLESATKRPPPLFDNPKENGCPDRLESTMGTVDSGKELQVSSTPFEMVCDWVTYLWETVPTRENPYQVSEKGEPFSVGDVSYPHSEIPKAECPHDKDPGVSMTFRNG